MEPNEMRYKFLKVNNKFEVAGYVARMEEVGTSLKLTYRKGIVR